MPTQKTWQELLGSDTTNAFVEGKMIVRAELPQGRGRMTVLWTFDSNEQARDAMLMWKHGASLPGRT